MAYRTHLCVILLLPTLAAAAVCDVSKYGAKGDGKTKDTTAIAKAVNDCVATGGGTILFPPGRYLTGAITLKSNLTLEVEAGATILGSPDPEDYPLYESPWAGDGNTGGSGKTISSLIYAEDAENVTIRGRGTIDGQGENWWRRMARGRRGEQRTPEQQAEFAKLANGRPRLIEVVRCKFVVIEQLHLINSAVWTIHPFLSEFVRVDGVTIQNPVPSPNTDGINPESSRNVQILNSRIDVGDDCVTLKSGMNEAGRKLGRPDENITITNCVMLRGHGGVTIGSEMSGGVRNVVVSNCVFQGTEVGIRVKSQRGRGGVVEGLAASNIVMQDVRSAFTITTFYMGQDKPGDEFPVNEGTPTFRDFIFNNIIARGSQTAGQVTGLKELAVENITFNNVQIQAKAGMTCTNAKGIRFLDTIIDPDSGPALTLVNSSAIDTSRLSTRKKGIELVK